MMRLFNLRFLILFPAAAACAGALAPALDSGKIPSQGAPAALPPAGILDRMEENTWGIRDAQAQITFRILIQKLGFPFTVRADYYFKQPDKTKISFRGLPGLIAGEAPKTIGAATTLSGFRKDYQNLYRARLQDIRSVEGQSCYELELTPKTRDGNVEKTVLWVNRKNYTVPQFLTRYKDGSWVEVKQVYAPVENHLLVSHMDAAMDFVKSNLRADVKADYSAYKLNRGLSDTIF